MHAHNPVLLPIGDGALLVRFADELSDHANLEALSLADRLFTAAPKGVTEIVPNLISVLVRYDQKAISFDALSGEMRLLLSGHTPSEAAHSSYDIGVRFGDEDGPDLDEVALSLGMSAASFVAAHNAQPLRVLAVGFAPGFVYCGFHDQSHFVPRRKQVRPLVPAGSILFAAGQTAITATPIPTGWNVIGRTDFINFDTQTEPPVRMRGGDRIRFFES